MTNKICLICGHIRDIQIEYGRANICNNCNETNYLTPRQKKKRKIISYLDKLFQRG